MSEREKVMTTRSPADLHVMARDLPLRNGSLISLLISRAQLESRHHHDEQRLSTNGLRVGRMDLNLPSNPNILQNVGRQRYH
jgi:hypothetical protein